MRYEKEMIPILADYLNDEMGYSVISSELDSGYGIADLVATTELTEYDYHPFNNLLDVFLLNSIPYMKTVTFEEIREMSSYSDKHLRYVVLKDFIDSGYLVKSVSGYRRIKTLAVKNNPIVAIEAKLKKWKDAFYQSARYRKYADYCYVALPENTLKNVNLQMFKDSNIGLLAISSSKSVYQVLKPLRNKDRHSLYTIYVNGVLYKNNQPDVS